MANAINWFEIPAADLNRAKSFYENVLGYELTLNEMGPLKMAMFPMEQGGSGSTATLIQAESYVPSHQGSMVSFSVEDIESSLARGFLYDGRFPMMQGVNMDEKFYRDICEPLSLKLEYNSIEHPTQLAHTIIF